MTSGGKRSGQRGQQFRLQPPVGCTQAPRGLGPSVHHLGRRHAALGLRRQPVRQQCGADAGAEVVQHQLGDIEPPRCRERREARRARRLGDDGAGDQADGGGVEDAVILGLPDPRRCDGGILEHQFDHQVGGADIRQRLADRTAPIGLAGRLEPAESDEGVFREASLGERPDAAVIAGEKRREARRMAIGMNGFEDPVPSRLLRAVGAAQRRRQLRIRVAGGDGRRSQAPRAPDGVEPAGDAFLQHRLAQQHGGEAQGGGLARGGFLDQQDAGAGDDQVQEGLVHLKGEVGTVEMQLQHLGGVFERERRSTGSRAVIQRPGGREAEPARPGWAKLGEERGGELLSRIRRRRVEDLRGLAGLRQGLGVAILPEGLEGAAAVESAGVACQQLLERQALGRRGPWGHADTPANEGAQKAASPDRSC